jgi:hypothetical protein
MTREQIAEAFAAFGEQVALEAAVPGPRRRREGTAELAAAIGTVLGPGCAELRTSAGRALLEVLAAKLGDMLGETWQRGYDLGKGVAAAGIAGASPESAEA